MSEKHMRNNPKILVVEDFPSDQKMIAMALERESYEVITAMDGKEGVEKARKEKPDVIIMDVMMPEEDGLDACKELKTDPECSNIPIIIHTSIQDSPIILREMQKTTDSPYADAYIDKPCDPNALLEVVKRFINLSEFINKK